MENFLNQNNTENSEEQMANVAQTAEIDTNSVGENIDLKGGRVLEVPDFVELATMGFSEDELKSILRLRRRFQEGDHEATPEHIRLRFARFLFESGKIES